MPRACFEKLRFLSLVIGLACLMDAPPVAAVTAIGQIRVTVSRHVSIINAGEMSFGSVSVNATPGTLILAPSGELQVTGGVQTSSSDVVQPARFIIEGIPNISYTLAFPTEVEMTDGQGNRIKVDNFSGSSPMEGSVGTNGTLELTVGGRLNLDANQPSGEYSGTLQVELEYR